MDGDLKNCTEYYLFSFHSFYMIHAFVIPTEVVLHIKDEFWSLPECLFFYAD